MTQQESKPYASARSRKAPSKAASQSLADLQAAAARAASAREWEVAGDLYKQALARTGKSPRHAPTRYELLSRRAECYGMTGNFVAEAANLDARLGLVQEMDRCQVPEQITSDLHLRDIRVIMTTAAEKLDSVVQCKVVGQPILIDETTRLGLRTAIRVVDQGELQLKGKTQAVRVFSVPEGQKCS